MNKLILASEIKTLLVFNANFDSAVILDEYIFSAQKNHLQYLLGQDFFNQVIITPASYTDLVSGVTYTKTDGYQVVFDGLKKYLAYLTIYEALPFIYAQLGRAGIFKSMVENSERITIDELQMLRNIYLNKAGIESNFIMNYLADNSSSYQAWGGQTNETINKFIGGILL